MNKSGWWLTTVVTTTLIVAAASFLPWISMTGGFSATNNAFGSTFGALSVSLPNWLVLAACGIVTVYAVLQRMGIADLRSPVPILLSGWALLQTAVSLVAALVAQPQKADVTVSGVPSEFEGAFRQSYYPEVQPTVVHVEPGLVIATVACAWLLFASIRLIRSFGRTEPAVQPAAIAE